MSLDYGSDGSFLKTGRANPKPFYVLFRHFLPSLGTITRPVLSDVKTVPVTLP